MSANVEPRAEWLGAQFWERLDRLESRHRQIQLEHESARRCLDRIDPQKTAELREAWVRYCEVIAELERTTGELETLRWNAS